MSQGTGFCETGELSNWHGSQELVTGAAGAQGWDWSARMPESLLEITQDFLIPTLVKSRNQRLERDGRVESGEDGHGGRVGGRTWWSGRRDAGPAPPPRLGHQEGSKEF